MSEFVKVKHADGREADVTPQEVAYYGSIGFAPVDRLAVPTASGDAASPANDLPPVVTAADQWSAAIVARLDRLVDAMTPVLLADPIEGETIEVREPEKAEPAPKAATEPKAAPKPKE